MSADIRERLRRLGVHKGVAHLKPSPAKILEEERAKAATAKLNVEHDHVRDVIPLPTSDANFSLSTIDTPFGRAAFRRSSYALDHTHGDRPLRQALHHPDELIGRLAGRTVPAFDLSDALFIDTETTGLAGGAGTLAFLVGMGYFVKDDDRRITDAQTDNTSALIPHSSSFVIDQFFLRDPAEELAMLHQIDALLASRQHIVTFNGRSFDVPLLETRFTLSRMPSSFEEKVHLDLLMPARRAWRNMIGACNLGALEYHLLGVRRDQQDIAGFLIPELYREWLAHNTGELNPDMQRVMYHNLHDILSMVTLSARLCEAFAQPNHPSEHLAIGKEHEQRGAWDQAERVYRAANAQLPKHDANISRRLAHTLKKQGKLEEAVPYWQALADNNDTEALIELAKYYEWRNIDYELAMRFAQRAMQYTQNPLEQQALTHRIERLDNKKRRALQPASQPAPNDQSPAIGS